MRELLSRLAARDDIRQFARFFSVSVLATLLQYCVLAGLVELAHAPQVAASIAGYLSGAVVAYNLNRVFVFSGTQVSYHHGVAKFLVVNLTGLALNTLIFAILTRYGVYYLLAQIVATGIVFFWNYFGQRLFVFR